MQHCVEAGEIVEFDVPRVLADGGNPTDFAALRERAARIEIAVETDHVVSRPNQHRRENRADVAQMSGHQYPHYGSPCRVSNRLFQRTRRMQGA